MRLVIRILLYFVIFLSLLMAGIGTVGGLMGTEPFKSTPYHTLWAFVAFLFFLGMYEAEIANKRGLGHALMGVAFAIFLAPLCLMFFLWPDLFKGWVVGAIFTIIVVFIILALRSLVRKIFITIGCWG